MFDQTKSTTSSEEMKTIEEQGEWLHLCYIDDIECFYKFSNIGLPYSLDFCTDNTREPYFAIMNKAEIIFDSRERKHLYKSIFITTPLILHDEHGFEIIINGEVTFKEDNVSLPNLNVNGAGDLFAAFFIEHYSSLGLVESSKRAMVETTETLIKRKKNE